MVTPTKRVGVTVSEDAEEAEGSSFSVACSVHVWVGSVTREVRIDAVTASSASVRRWEMALTRGVHLAVSQREERRVDGLALAGLG